jgi:hypothetical protein
MRAEKGRLEDAPTSTDNGCTSARPACKRHCTPPLCSTFAAKKKMAGVRGLPVLTEKKKKEGMRE